MPKFNGRTVQPYLGELFELFDQTCFFCKEPVMLVRYAEEFGWKFNSRVITRHDGIQIKVGTTEHFVPRSKGGSNVLCENLFLACAECNKRRNLLFNGRSLARMDKEGCCIRCGNFFSRKSRKSKDGKRCTTCRARAIESIDNYFDIIMGHA